MTGQDQCYLRSGEVARWARHGKLPCQRTLGGQLRYPADKIRQLARTLVGNPEQAGERDA